MNQRIKIFIVEYDCVSLITLMLWLDQFPEFDVLGTTVDTGSLRQKLMELQPDVVLINIQTPGPEDIMPLRAVRSVNPSPAVLLLYHGDDEGLDGVLKLESDGQLGPERTLGDLREAITKAYNRRQVVLSSLLPSVALAG